MKDRSVALGYLCGIASGCAYGLNPLFAKPLSAAGVSVDSMLFFRYIISVLLLGGWLLCRKSRVKITWKQLGLMALLGVFFASSSLTLFQAYLYIPSGLATTLSYLYPVMVALLMVFLRVYPSWKVWFSVLLGLAGVFIICSPGESSVFDLTGVVLASLSSLAYALYLVILGRSKSISGLPENVVTFWCLLIGSVFFPAHFFLGSPSESFLHGMNGLVPCLSLLGLSLFPTIVAMLCLAVSSRLVGATKTSVLGVFEPITGIVVGILVFGECMTWNSAIGALISIFAVLFMVLTTSRRAA